LISKKTDTICSVLCVTNSGWLGLQMPLLPCFGKYAIATELSVLRERWKWSEKWIDPLFYFLRQVGRYFPDFSGYPIPVLVPLVNPLMTLKPGYIQRKQRRQLTTKNYGVWSYVGLILKFAAYIQLYTYICLMKMWKNLCSICLRLFWTNWK
jgi:hypothetical protein